MIASSLAWLTEQSRVLVAAVSPTLHAVASLDWTAIAMWTGVGVVLLVPGAACVWMARRLGRIRYVPIERLEQVDHRITKLSAALSLLTDTTEAAFRDVMQEIERQTRADSQRVAVRAACVRTAAHRPRSQQRPNGPGNRVE